MMGVRATNDSFHQAQALFNAGNFARGREVALEGLAERPDDVNLLRLAGKCSLELGQDAASYFQRVVNLQPDDVESWHDLGDALVEDGQLEEAAGAMRQVVRIRPTDVTALLDLGLILRQLGQERDAIPYLQAAADAQPGNLQVMRALVDIYRRTGQTETALEAARQIVDLQPQDVLASMDVADISLELGKLDEAVAAYSTLRRIDEEDHEVYAYHGMIQAEMQRERWRRALDLAIDATRIDRYGLTTDLLAFNVAQVFGSSDRPVPSRAEVDAALAAEQAEHRRLHTEELAL
jgi:tetratricopeptide (TPR) repeat protein